jgi:hypothetical protein
MKILLAAAAVAAVVAVPVTAHAVDPSCTTLATKTLRYHETVGVAFHPHLLRVVAVENRVRVRSCGNAVTIKTTPHTVSETVYWVREVG